MNCRACWLIVAMTRSAGAPRLGAETLRSLDRRGSRRRGGPEQPRSARRARQPVDRRRQHRSRPVSVPTRCCREAPTASTGSGTGFDERQQRRAARYSVRVDVPFERGAQARPPDRRRRPAAARRRGAARRLRAAPEARRHAREHRRARGQGEAPASREDNLQTLERLVELNERRLDERRHPAARGHAVAGRDAAVPRQRQERAADADRGATASCCRCSAGRPDDVPVDIDDRLGVTPPAGRRSRDAAATARATRPDLLAAPRRPGAQRRPTCGCRSAQGKVDYTLGAEYRRAAGRQRKRQHARLLRQRAAAGLQSQPGRDRAGGGRTREGRPFADGRRHRRRRRSGVRVSRSSSRRARCSSRSSATCSRPPGKRGPARPTSIRPAPPRCSTCSTRSGPSTTPWTPTTRRRPPTAAPRPGSLVAVSEEVLP